MRRTRKLQAEVRENRTGSEDITKCDVKTGSLCSLIITQTMHINLSPTTTATRWNAAFTVFFQSVNQNSTEEQLFIQISKLIFLLFFLISFSPSLSLSFSCLSVCEWKLKPLYDQRHIKDDESPVDGADVPSIRPQTDTHTHSLFFLYGVPYTLL